MQPSSASIQILNIKERYYPGISLSPGEHTILVEADGYHSIRKTVTLPPGQQCSIEVKLKSKGPKQGDIYTDPTTGMELVFVKGGCFQMGDTFGDGEGNEKPVHEVCIDGFYIGKYEVTQGEYRRITGENPSRFKSGDRYPVERVSWNDARDFIRNINRKSSKNYRLPTEAEWEHAARSGGRNEKYAGANSLGGVAWYDSNSNSTTHRVGTKSPNTLGIYDMTGNVWEWCQNWYSKSYYSNSPSNNPQGPSSGASRVIRSGSWSYDARGVRAALRSYFRSDYSSSNLGFRLVLPVQ